MAITPHGTVKHGSLQIWVASHEAGIVGISFTTLDPFASYAAQLPRHVVSELLLALAAAVASTPDVGSV